MDDEALLASVRALRSKGFPPKGIARALSVRPAIVTPLLRQIAQEGAASAPESRVVECWVSPSWSDGLGIEGHPEWLHVDRRSERHGGLAAVLVARDHRGHRVSVCGYLVDVYCLGVKDTLGPRVMHERDLTAFVQRYFEIFDAPPLAISLELAQHLVLGAVDYAQSLGFAPSPSLEATRGHLGAWSGSSAIRFGNQGKPFFIQGPRDDPRLVLRTLERSVGEGEFHFSVAFDAEPGRSWEWLGAESMV